MTEPVGVDLQINGQEWAQSAGLAATAAGALNSQLIGLAATATLTSRALDAATPSKKHQLAWGAATGAAADYQKQLGSFNATQAITGQRTASLSKSVLQLSRDIPVGTGTVLQTVSAVTQLGVSMKGSEKQVAALSKTFIQLQGANGGSAPQYAQSLIQLERTFGDQGLDPKRISDTGDALTYVSKMSGASAQSVLNFSNAIGPIAQSAGIGKVATLGIAAGFSRIGQDGTYAATAVSKVLSDLNNSVRYGGPQLNTYANIVGQTATNFERIYKANPTQALNSVIQAIGNSGQMGPYLLQSLGLDGVRSQRAIQGIASQGGISAQVNQAIAGYGSGATAKASNAAFDGVSDNLARAGESAKQVALAFGEPLLRPLGTFASVLSTVSRGVAGATGGLLGNRYVNSALAYGGLAYGATRLATRVGLGASIGNQLIRSGPVGGFSLGRRLATGADAIRDRNGIITQVGRSGVMGNTAGYVAAGYERGELGPITTRAMGVGQAFGSWQQSRVAATTARNLAYGLPGDARGGIFGTIRNAGSLALGGYAGLGRASLDVSREPDPTARQGMFSERLRRYSPFGGGLSAAGSTLLHGSQDPEVGRLTAATMKLRQGMESAGTATAGFATNLGRSAKYIGSAAFGGLAPRANQGLGATIGRGVGAVAGGVGSLLTSPAGLLLAGVAGFGIFQSIQAKQRQQQHEYQQGVDNTKPTSYIDAYNESLGLATSATTTFTGALSAAAQQVAANTGKQQSRTVSGADINTAAAQKGQVVTYPELGGPSKFGGGGSRASTEEETAAAIRAASPQGLDPGSLQKVKLDLIKQYGPEKAQSIINSLPQSSTGAWIYGKGQSQSNDLSTLIRGAAKAQPGAQPGMPGASQTPNKQVAGALSLGFQGLEQNFQNASQTIGQPYAEQQLYRSVNAGALTAGQTNNQPVVQAYADQAWKAMGMTGNAPKIYPQDLRAADGNLVDVFAKKSQQFKTQWQSLQQTGVTLEGTGISSAKELGPIAKSLAGSGIAGMQFDNTLDNKVGPPPKLGTVPLSDTFGRGIFGTSGPLSLRPTSQPTADVPLSAQALATNRLWQASGKATQAALLAPDDAGKLNTAVNTFIETLMKASQANLQHASATTKAAAADATAAKGLGSLQTVIGKAGDNTPQGQIAQAQFQGLQNRQQFQSYSTTSGASVATDLQNSAAIINAGQGTSTQSKQNFADAKKSFQADIGELNQMVVQAATTWRDYQTQTYRAQRSYEMQSSRATEDFYTQQSFAATAFAKQQQYSTEDFNTQAGFAQKAFQLQQTYSYEDYYKGILRQQQDFGIQMTQSTEDYQHQIAITTRDFNKNLSRQISDQAQAMYDPYKRITTQAVWDGNQLLANMQEQNSAIAKQQKQLQQARGFGLSDQSITQLGLNDPANAQQLAKLIDNFMSDPKLAAQLNAQSKTRVTIGGLLLQDPSNKEIARAKEDFATQLKDMEYAYDVQINRAKAAFDLNAAREYQDFATQLQRQTQQYDISVQQSTQLFNTSMARQTEQYGISVAESTQLFNTQMTRMGQDYRIQLADMAVDVNTAESTLTAKTGDLFGNLQKITSGKWNDVKTTVTKGLADTTKIVSDPTNVKAFNQAYKNIFPYDLSKIQWGTGGPDNPGNLPHGGPYATQAAAGMASSLFGGSRTGVSVSQGFGMHGGGPNTGGGWPVGSPVVTQNYGDNPTSRNPGGHPGIDLAVPTGTPITAPLPGVVVFAGWNDGYGNCTIMDNGGGRSTLYGHQERIAVHDGQVVKAGDVIGWVDSTGNSTGPHLHFETRQNGLLQNPAVDLPQWEATAGLGSFDPGAVAASYGLGSNAQTFQKLKKKDFQKNYGPFGGFIEGFLILDALNKQAQAMNLSDTSGASAATGADVPGHEEEKDYAKSQFAKYGWSIDAQFPSLDTLWEHESNWNRLAENSIGAYGIPQSYPGNKMASAGADWRTNYKTQINWGLQYIHDAYGTPAAAWGQWHHADGNNSYGDGFISYSGATQGEHGTYGERGNEVLMPLNNSGVSILATAMSQVMGADALRAILTPGSTERVSYVSSFTHEDHSVSFPNAQLSVVDSDPMSMARKLEAKARQAALTAPRGGR